MSNPTEGASVPIEHSSSEYREFIVKRDGNRPISFSGKILARVSMGASLNLATITAALYQTRGGKFVSSLSRSIDVYESVSRTLGVDSPPGGEFNKAQVFDSFPESVAWFRPGRLTNALRKQLGLDEPERIE